MVEKHSANFVTRSASALPLPKAVVSLEDTDQYLAEYDVGLFASGYEPRARHCRKWLNDGGVVVQQELIFGFKTLQEDPERQRNDRFFQSLGAKLVLVGYSEPNEIWSLLQKEFANLRDGARIVIDYSSMSRTWISAIAAWLVEANTKKGVTVDWMYSMGDYKAPFQEQTHLKEVRKAPGTHGGVGVWPKSMLVCGIGVDRSPAQTLMEHVEINEVVVLHALNQLNPELNQQVESSNRKLMDGAVATLRIPLRAVANTYSVLREVAQANIARKNVVMAALGPKPHFLAMVLLGLSMPQVHILHVSREWSRHEVVSSVDPMITRLTLMPTS